ncbi:MAG: DUF2752 domain-containing protein [Prevotella sp.]|nr:DUF2752 domain-containing protein [Prevotella sp.]
MQKDRIFAATVIGAIIAWLFVGNPENPSAAFLKCPLHQITGLQCPLCGTQRAVHHLLHLRIGRAFTCNPWLVAIGVYAAVYATGRWRSRRAVLTMVALTMAWGIVRNLFLNI